MIGVASAPQGFRSMCTYSVVEIVHLWQILVYMYHGTPGSDNVAKVEILTVHVPCLVFSLLFRFTIIICQLYYYYQMIMCQTVLGALSLVKFLVKSTIE